MLRLPLSFFWWFASFFRSHHDLGLELVASRQQLGVLKRKNPRPRLSPCDRLFWVTFRRLWSKWADVLIVVKPETVVSWHRAGFRLYWRFLSRRSPGRRRITPEPRQLIQRMASENPTRGAPRIHGQLLKLGFDVSERAVSRYLARLGRRGEAGKDWLIFLKNHREGMAAIYFFTVPTATFRVLYCFFVISHGRRRVLHFNATEHPTSEWIVQQIREAFPEATANRYLILGRDSKYEEATEMLKSLGRKLIRTAYRSPWQDGVAERWVGSCRRELLDHVIVLSEAHLRRLVREYVRYYHEDRIHDALNKDTPERRPVERRKAARSRVVAMSRVGGLHHRYTWHSAA